MGYNLRETYCDLANLEGASGIAKVSAIFGKDILEGHKAEEGNFVDLNLGNLGDVREGLRRGLEDRKAPLMDSFSGGSSKRARAPSSGGQIVSCLVDGCKSDLSKCRDYHRRHKVCEMHSKTPKVTIGGHEQRFCQQCSRFHSLGEFDEGKRSCRKRLEGHNRRRRKPQPEPLPVTHANFLSASPGGRYLPFSNQPLIPTSSVASATWSGAVKPENNQTVFNGSYSQPLRGRRFPFLQGNDSLSSGQLLHHHNPSELNQVMDSDRSALSLLSSSPAETPEMGLGRIIQPSPIHPAQSRPTMSGLLYTSMAQFPGSEGMEGQAGGSASAFLSNMRSSNSLCQDVFQSRSGSHGSSASTTGGGFSWD